MKIIYVNGFNQGLKKLKKHHIEYNNSLKIIDFIENTSNFNELKASPFAKMYGFERLKYQNNKYYSFNPIKKGGVIRIIVRPKENNELEIYLVKISFDHYQDFDSGRVIIDD